MTSHPGAQHPQVSSWISRMQLFLECSFCVHGSFGIFTLARTIGVHVRATFGSLKTKSARRKYTTFRRIVCVNTFLPGVLPRKFRTPFGSPLYQIQRVTRARIWFYNHSLQKSRWAFPLNINIFYLTMYNLSRNLFPFLIFIFWYAWFRELQCKYFYTRVFFSSKKFCEVNFGAIRNTFP